MIVWVYIDIVLKYSYVTTMFGGKEKSSFECDNFSRAE
jgi:hypothetical protein